MPLPILRNYQLDAQDKIYTSQAAGFKRTLLVVPTGGGKTNIASDTILKEVKAFKKILFIAHRKELIEQAQARLELYGVLAGRIQGKHKFIGSSVNVASVQTLVNLEAMPEADIVFIDEAHHFVLEGAKVKKDVGAEPTPEISYDGGFKVEHLTAQDAASEPEFKPSMYAKVFEHYKDKAHFIGLTATPTRLDGKGLADVFQDLVFPEVDGEIVDIAWLTKNGFLVDVVYYGAPFDIDTSDIKVDNKTGDFNQKKLFDKFNKKEIYAGIAENWLKHANGLKTIAFAPNIEACIKHIEEFKKHGIAVDMVHGAMNKTEREEKLNLFKHGLIQVLWNVGILTEGYDLPDIECVCAAMATDSVSLWMQILGRGLRPIYAPGADESTIAGRLAGIASSKKKHLLVLDAGTNCKRLGFADDFREYSLEGKKKEKGGGVPPVRECKELEGGCGLLFPARLPVCPDCGKEFVAPKEEKIPEKVDMVQLRKNHLPEELAAKPMHQLTLEELEHLRAYYKNHFGWCVHELKRRAEASSTEDNILDNFKALLKEYAALVTPTKKAYSSKWVYVELKKYETELAAEFYS